MHKHIQAGHGHRSESGVLSWHQTRPAGILYHRTKHVFYLTSSWIFPGTELRLQKTRKGTTNDRLVLKSGCSNITEIEKLWILWPITFKFSWVKNRCSKTFEQRRGIASLFLRYCQIWHSDPWRASERATPACSVCAGRPRLNWSGSKSGCAASIADTTS